MLFDEFARTSAAVAETRARGAKIELLASCLRRLTPEEVVPAVTYLSGGLARLGVGWASLRDAPPAASPPPSLELLDVENALARLAAAAGAGSQAARRDRLTALLAAATEPEQQFLRRLLGGELRQGALTGVMVDAVAKASGLAVADVRRAHMLAGDLAVVARAALVDGTDGLAGFRLEVLRPIGLMLAQSAADVAEALSRTGAAGIEWKLDGARLQVHRRGRDVRVFTRSLADVTDRVPEVVQATARLPLDTAVLDGEVIALAEDGRPLPFQDTMSRFGSSGRRGDRNQVPLTPFFFDCLHLDGEDLFDRPYAERVALLVPRVPEGHRVPRIETAEPAEAEGFLEAALARGHEGVLVKSVAAPYEAGRRGAGWVKVKRSQTLDLVVLAAEWGHGRRQGRLSNLHLGARDTAGDRFVMLGKTFKGMTDAMLAWQTEKLLELARDQDGHVVHVRPKLVVEIAFDGVQRSARYPGGIALRFARLKGYRPDKTPAEADTIDAVHAFLGDQTSAAEG
jgi:DNA ligase-1